MPTRLWAGRFSPPPAMCASRAVRCSSPNPDRKGEKQAPGMEQSRVAKNRVYKTVEEIDLLLIKKDWLSGPVLQVFLLVSAGAVSAPKAFEVGSWISSASA